MVHYHIFQNGKHMRTVQGTSDIVVLKTMQRLQSQSMDWAFKYEGWKVEYQENGKWIDYNTGKEVTAPLLKYYTFSIEGLNPNQIAFLAACETMFFTTSNIEEWADKDIWQEALIQSQSEKGEDIYEAWQYWKSTPRALYKDSVRNPILLNELFELSETQKGKLYTHISTHRSSEVFKDLKYGKYIGKIALEILNVSGGKLGAMSGDNIYFEICENRLYLGYQQILGTRYIADVKVN